MPPIDNFLLSCISDDLKLSHSSVKATIELLMDGATVHFIARYRKEKTSGLDEIQVRLIEERLAYYTSLAERKKTVLSSIEQQGNLSDALRDAISFCRNKQKLEDLYRPYKPKRRTRATIAREKGLEPLAELIFLQATLKGRKEDFVQPFIKKQKGVDSYDAAIGGAIDIIAEKIADDASIRESLRKYYLAKGKCVVKAMPDFVDKHTKFSDYYKYVQPIKEIPSHRLLAIRRGAKEKVLMWRISVDENFVINLLENRIIKSVHFLFYEELKTAVKEGYKRLLVLSIEMEVFVQCLEKAEKEAIDVFARNLRNLLMFPPAGHRVIMGIDPGYTSGCKVAVIDQNGNFKEYTQIFPTPPKADVVSAEQRVLALIERWNVEIIAIGNGTGSRETYSFIKNLLSQKGLDIKAITVSEAGASVYSASPVAIKEFPNEDVTVRGAISIARRVQDPLSELVKIDPKSIGVGQYQHDVNQAELKRALTFIVESCVNHVGVDLNTASVELLSYVSGVGRMMAANIVQHRKKIGTFRNKEQLKSVPRMGEKIFEQCAGFLRIYKGDNPLDNSAIHPERYRLVERMAKDIGLEIKELIGNSEAIATIEIQKYVGEDIGIPTLQDIVRELMKPGVDPRRDFSSVEFDKEVRCFEDIKEGMILSGMVTNVTNFGAFVDIGVHHDALIHVSKLSTKFVNDPYRIVAVGDFVKVKVLSIDENRRRIALQLIEKISQV